MHELILRWLTQLLKPSSKDVKGAGNHRLHKSDSAYHIKVSTVKCACSGFVMCCFLLYIESHRLGSPIANFERNGASGFHTQKCVKCWPVEDCVKFGCGNHIFCGFFLFIISKSNKIGV